MSNALNDAAEKAAHILHELRTPLNIILGYSEMILEEAQALPNQTAADVLRKITQTGEIIAELINRFAVQLANETKGVGGGGRAIVLNKILESKNQIMGFAEMLKSCDLTTESGQDVNAIMAACGKLEYLVRHL